MRYMAALLLGMTLAGCASLRPPPPTAADPGAYQARLRELAPITHFSAAGRMGVQTQQKGFSGKFHWTHAPDRDRLSFFSPLGAQVAELVADAGGVTLTTSDRKTYRADDIETLLQQTLGWSMPVAGLTDWALGRPAPQPYQELRWNDRGQLTYLHQQQWQIEYPAYSDGQQPALPSRIVLRSPQLDLKLLVEQWNLTPPAQ